jgi:hypothetical protein
MQSFSNIKSVFVVICCLSDYEDSYEDTTRAFADKESADAFAKEMDRKIGAIVELSHTVSTYMEGWELSHPFNDAKEDVVTYCREYQAESDAEEKRISDLIGFKKENLPNGAERGYACIVREVPFGPTNPLMSWHGMPE